MWDSLYSVSVAKGGQNIRVRNAKLATLIPNMEKWRKYWARQIKKSGLPDWMFHERVSLMMSSSIDFWDEEGCSDAVAEICKMLKGEDKKEITPYFSVSIDGKIKAKNLSSDDATSAANYFATTGAKEIFIKRLT